MKIPRLYRWFSLFMIFLAGCSTVPELLSRLTPSAGQTQEAIVTPGPTDTPPSSPVECAYVWSNRSLPELSQVVTQVLKDAGWQEVEAQASAFGEDCLDPRTNTVAGFSAMQTDFYFTIPVEDTADGQLMGEWVERMIHVLEQVPAEQVPGPNAGYISITFEDGAQMTNLWFSRLRAQSLVQQGTRGNDLYEALRTIP